MHLRSTRPLRLLSKRHLCGLAVAVALSAPALVHAQVGEDLVIRSLKWKGNKSVSTALLENSIITTNSSFFARVAPFKWLGFLGEKRYFSQRDFEADVLRVGVLYKLSGFPDAQVDTVVTRREADIALTFVITEGKPVIVDSFAVLGLDSVSAKVRRAALIDLPLQQGDIFNRGLMRQTADTITRRLQDRGYPSADVFVSFRTSREAKTASLSLQAEPGVPAVVGSVRVEGSEHVDSAFVVKLLQARPGQTYSRQDLFDSQRNLYSSDHFRLASVNIDTTRFRKGMDSVPLLVEVAESPPHRARAGLGYGTSDCLRANGGFTVRNFLGHAKLLDITSRVSKVGIGQPLDWGLENGLCRALRDDSLGSGKLNYSLQASLRRPAFRSPNNTLILSAFTERRSEFKVYRRTEQGVSATIARETPRHRLPLSLTYTLAFGRTDATAASFCAFLNACQPADVDRLSQRLRQGTVTASAAIPRANNPLDPSRGYVASTQLTVASRFFGSSSLVQFGRLVADYTSYQPLTRDIVFSWHVRLGGIVAPGVTLAGGTSASYVPPDQRFYGGGPNDVRGYQRNELGPVVYTVSRQLFDSLGVDGLAGAPDSVRVVATGGNTLAVANAEVRIPSPFFRERLRLAAFVDAGTVFQRGQGSASRAQVRVTPGVGLRVATPLGPARFDIAYNPYKLPIGTLYVRDDQTGTVQILPNAIQLDRHRNFTIHFAVGQPF
ncbi:MAG: BamA/TamA family outer membrane protein [Gemmatimonadales bacterium]|nr:BamA/TamA family outer membrane protein [Gemmatimonadales bacterium]